MHADDKFDAEALHWLQIATSAFKRFTDHLPSDGTYHEGIGYIDFGLTGLIPSLMLLEQLTDQTWLAHDWLNAHFTAMNDLLPMHHGQGFDIDDGDHCLPFNPAFTMWAWRHASDSSTRQAAGQLLAKVAAHNTNRLNNPQWIAEKYWRLLFCPQLTALKENLPTPQPATWKSKLLPSAGYCLFNLGKHQHAFFLTAPPHGHELFKRERHTYAYGHHHPDTGNVLLIDDGKWILSDTGYNYCKTSREHNVLLVDGQGQHNDGYVWMPPPPWDIKPTHVELDQHTGHSLAKIDLSYIYPKSLGLDSWVRTVYASEDCLVIVDQMQSARPAKFTISWGSDEPWKKQSDNTYTHPMGWRMTPFGDPCQITQQRVTPARRFLDHSQDWHVLRLGNTKPVTTYHLVSVFEKSPRNAPQTKLNELGITS